MLEIEQQKMYKKINATRKRAEQILKTKRDNEDNFINRLRFQKARDENLERMKDQNNSMKEASMRRRKDFSFNQLSLRKKEAQSKRYMTKLSD